MLSVVGLGQAGSNIAEEASKLGILSGAINFSQKDLDSVEVRHKLRLLGSEGVGKDRQQAISLFQDQWEIASKFIQDNFSNSKVIAFAFSSAGGSGSGIAPILIDVAINTMPDKTFIALVVLPESNEATTSQANCLRTFEELSSLDVAVFPIDNQQVRNQNPVVGKNKLFEISNKSSVNLLNKLISYTDKTSKNGNFDERDLITVLKTKGIAIISETDIASLSKGLNLTPDGVAQKVKHSWMESIFVPIEKKKVTRAAIIFDGQESLMDSVRNDLMFNDFGNSMPMDLFEGAYHEANGKILSVLTGLDWCSTRLNDIDLLTSRNKDKVESLMVNQDSYQAKSTDFLNKIRKPQQEPKKPDIMAILNKYKR